VQHAHPMTVLLWTFAAAAALIVLSVVAALAWMAITGTDDKAPTDDEEPKDDEAPPATGRGLPPFFFSFVPQPGGTNHHPHRPSATSPPPPSPPPPSPPPPDDTNPFTDPASILFPLNPLNPFTDPIGLYHHTPDPGPPPPAYDPGPSIDTGSTGPDCGGCDPGCGS
jgi:hypothetical protein